jgi:hypothetical protein
VGRHDWPFCETRKEYGMPELVADLVEPAKAEALDKLGEGRRALDIAAGWVRGKLGSAAAPETPPR